MSKIVQARLGDETIKYLSLLEAEGYSQSEAIREGIKLLSHTIVQKKKGKTIIGLGKFESGVKDLGSNKKHLSGFGNGKTFEILIPSVA